MKKILLPFDFSDLSEYAYHLALQVAESTGAEILAMCVVSAPANAIFDSAGNLKDDEYEDFEQFYAEQQNKEAAFEKWAADKPLVKETRVKIGNVNEDLLRCIREENVDMVVMGTHGATGLKEWLSGSHAEQIVRHSPVPVLTLKCDREGMVVNDILLVSDYHKPETLRLDLIVELQRAFDARINLLKINTKSDFEPTRKVMDHMRDFATKNGLENVRYHLYCDETVEKGIVNFCADQGIDFVAMGTHQRKGMQRILMNSIAEGVVNHIWQPILTFPM
jgi:nucleotide-binding universal stress UspA family protein